MEEDFGEGNDLIISSLILHLFNKEKSVNLINRMKKSTSKNGYNLLVCFSDKDVFAKKYNDLFYPSIEELKHLYENWKVIKELHDVTETENHGNHGPHQHNIIFLLVKK